MEIRLIGHVGVDSGQLLLCDPCYIDSEWQKEPFEDIRIYKHKQTGDQLQYGVHFANYEEMIPKYGKTMNELNATGEWTMEEKHETKYPFSYNACSQATLSEDGYDQLNYTMGHPGVGVAFRTAFGDGMYPVFATYDDNGDLMKVEVQFFSEDDEETDYLTEEDDE